MQNSDHNESLYFIGISGVEPAILQITRRQEAALVHKLDAGYSPYGLDYSYSRNLLAIGLSNSKSNHRLGKMMLVRPEEDNRSAQIIMDNFMPSSVLNVHILRSGLVVCGTIRGMIHGWHCDNPAEQVFSFQAHNGITASLSEHADGSIISLGTDNVVRIWSTEDGTRLNEYALEASSVVQPYFQTLCHIPESKQILAQFPGGFFTRITETDGNESNVPEKLRASRSAAIFGDRYALLDPKGTELSVFDMHHNQLSSIQSPASIGIKAVGPDTFIMIRQDKISELWSVSPLQKINGLPVTEFRSANPLKRLEYIEVATQMTHQKRDMLIEQAEQYLASDDFDALQGYCTEMLQTGLEMESWIVFSEWCKRHHRPLWELEARMRLCSMLTSGGAEEAVQFLALAHLLEKINEPVYSLQYYKMASERDEAIDGLQDKIEALQRIEDILNKADERLIDYFDSPDKALNEVQKYHIMGKPWQDALVTEKESFLLKIKPAKEVLDSLMNFLEKHDFSKRNAVFLNGGAGVIKQHYIEYNYSYESGNIRVIATMDATGSHYSINKKIKFVPPEGGADENLSDYMSSLIQQTKTDSFDKWFSMLSDKLEMASKAFLKQHGKTKRKGKKF